MRHSDVAARHHDAELLRHRVRLPLAADAGGIDEGELDAVAGDGLVDGVARGAGDGRDDGALLSGESVEEGRFAHVRTADDGDLDGGGLGGFRGGGHFGKCSGDAIEQRVDACAVLGGQRKDVADAEVVEVMREIAIGGSIDLVDGERDGLAEALEHLGEIAVAAGDLGAAIDEENDVRRFAQRDVGLAQDLRGDVLLVGDHDAAGIDQLEAATVMLGDAVDAVARDAGLVADDGAALSGDAIEEG